MPRRNRNAHTPRIDADELAAQAGQLSTELDLARWLRTHSLQPITITPGKAVTSNGRD